MTYDYRKHDKFDFTAKNGEFDNTLDFYSAFGWHEVWRKKGRRKTSARMLRDHDIQNKDKLQRLQGEAEAIVRNDASFMYWHTGSVFTLLISLLVCLACIAVGTTLYFLTPRYFDLVLGLDITGAVGIAVAVAVYAVMFYAESKRKRSRQAECEKALADIKAEAAEYSRGASLTDYPSRPLPGKRTNLAVQSALYILLAAAQVAAAVLVFVFLNEAYGWILIGLLIVDILLSLLLYSVHGPKEHKILYFICTIIGTGFGFMQHVLFTVEHRCTSASVRIGVSVAIFAQVAVTFGLYYIWLFGHTAYMIVAAAATVIDAIVIVALRGQPKDKALNILAVIGTFGIGCWLYPLLKREVVLLGYDRNLRKAEKSMDELGKGESGLPVPYPVLSENGFGAYAGGNATFFDSGAGFFDAVLDDISKAKDFVFVEFFITSEGVMFRRFMDVLMDRARNGVDVRMMLDGLGSLDSCRRAALDELREAGVSIAEQNSFMPVFSLSFAYCDHRKIVVVDGKTAFTGGINISDEYINEEQIFGYWMDNGARIEGGAVDGFTRMFLQKWNTFSSERENSPERFFGKNAVLPMPDAELEAPTVVPFSGDPTDGGFIPELYEQIIKSAESRLYIMMPYFMPTAEMFEAIAERARAGVDVRICLPGVPDKPIVGIVTRSRAEALLPYGAKLCVIRSGFVHGKVLLADDRVCIGSANFDYRSFYQQAECGACISGKSMTSSLEGYFEDIFQTNGIITADNAPEHRKFFGNIARVMALFTPLM